MGLGCFRPVRQASANRIALLLDELLIDAAAAKSPFDAVQSIGVVEEFRVVRVVSPNSPHLVGIWSIPPDGVGIADNELNDILL